MIPRPVQFPDGEFLYVIRFYKIVIIYLVIINKK